MPHITDQQVKDANQALFDATAQIYEQVDGRRSEELSGWLNGRLNNLARMTGGQSLLDIGCGTGFVMRKARGLFSRIYGVDISLNMLKEIHTPVEGRTCADIAFLPLQSCSVSAVSCLAVLHHCYNTLPVFKEAYRVLKKGGVLYTDHDIEKKFADRFNIPLKIYRRIFDAKKQFPEEYRSIADQFFDITEIHAWGIDAGEISLELQKVGFKDIQMTFHWEGISSIFNNLIKLFGGKGSFPLGFAPSLSLVARK